MHLAFLLHEPIIECVDAHKTGDMQIVDDKGSSHEGETALEIARIEAETAKINAETARIETNMLLRKCVFVAILILAGIAIMGLSR